MFQTLQKNAPSWDCIVTQQLILFFVDFGITLKNHLVLFIFGQRTPLEARFAYEQDGADSIESLAFLISLCFSTLSVQFAVKYPKVCCLGSFFKLALVHRQIKFPSVMLFFPNIIHTSRAAQNVFHWIFRETVPSYSLCFSDSSKSSIFWLPGSLHSDFLCHLWSNWRKPNWFELYLQKFGFSVFISSFCLLTLIFKVRREKRTITGQNSRLFV